MSEQRNIDDLMMDYLYDEMSESDRVEFRRQKDGCARTERPAAPISR